MSSDLSNGAKVDFLEFHLRDDTDGDHNLDDLK
jgi:hypothetical protein